MLGYVLAVIKVFEFTVLSFKGPSGCTIWVLGGLGRVNLSVLEVPTPTSCIHGSYGCFQVPNQKVSTHSEIYDS